MALDCFAEDAAQDVGVNGVQLDGTFAVLFREFLRSSVGRFRRPQRQVVDLDLFGRNRQALEMNFSVSASSLAALITDPPRLPQGAARCR
jgi:hypothetical protein